MVSEHSEQEKELEQKILVNIFFYVLIMYIYQMINVWMQKELLILNAMI